MLCLFSLLVDVIGQGMMQPDRQIFATQTDAEEESALGKFEEYSIRIGAGAHVANRECHSGFDSETR